MSAKIFVVTHYVDAFTEKIHKNLRLPVEEEDDDVWPMSYNVTLGHKSLFPLCPDALMGTEAIVYESYFENQSPTKPSYLRIEYFDIIRSLGLKELWVMNDMLPDCCGDIESCSFSEFLSRIMAQNPCYEFNVEDFVPDADGHYGCCSFYQDSFKDCFDMVDYIEEKYDVKVLGLKEYEGYIRVIKDGGIMLLDVETGKTTVWNDINYDKLREMISRCQWTFAKTMPWAPHEYIVRGKCPLTEEEFLYFIDVQRHFGIYQNWGKHYLPYLYVDNYRYWTMEAPIEDTIVINRAKDKDKTWNTILY